MTAMRITHGFTGMLRITAMPAPLLGTGKILQACMRSPEVSAWIADRQDEAVGSRNA
jgi:hypothetical protein